MKSPAASTVALFSSRRIVFSLRVWAVLLVMFLASSALTAPISNISQQKVSGNRSSPPYGWKYAYDISFTDYQLYVGIGIRLSGYTPSSTLKATWENGIENMWKQKFDIIDTDGANHYHYHVNFDVKFYVSANPSAYFNVNVINGIGRGNMLNWYTTTEWGEEYNGAYVAHEVGHMFSLYDEYSGGAVNPASPLIDYTSIMGSLAGDVKGRHYDPFLGWLQIKAPTHNLSIGVYDPTWQIPEPITLSILAIGGLFLRRKIR